MNRIILARRALSLTILLAAGATAFAQAPAAASPVSVQNAWARVSVPGQKASGAFMTLTAKSATRLVAVSSPAAAVTEVHEMKMDGDVMRMRAINGLDLPAGQPVELKPGGYHVMLMDLKAPLLKDTTVPVTLTFRDAKGAETRMDLQLPVGLAAPGAAPSAPAAATGHGQHKH